MMKKPVNSAIRPMPAVGRVRPFVRHELEPDPEDERPGDEQEREQELRVRAGDPAHPARPALGRHRRALDDEDHRDDQRRRDAERNRLLEGDQEELHARMLAEELDAETPDVGAAATMAPTSRATRTEAKSRRDLLRSTRPVRRATGLVDRGRLGDRARGRGPARSTCQRAAERRRLHPRRPRVGPRQGAPGDRARRTAVGARHRPEQRDTDGGDAGVRGGGRRRHPRHRHRAARRPGALAPPGAAPGLGRRAHRLRRRLPRPAAGRLARCRSRSCASASGPRPR